jgi:hypothetical protein
MTSYLGWSSKRVSHLISTHPSIMISIINQIQASITGETIDKLGRYDEMHCDDDKIEYIHGKARTPPQIKPKGWQIPIPPAKKQNESHQGVW